MITINPKKESGTWFTHPDEESIQFLIRPVSQYSFHKAPGDAFDIQLTDVADMFVYCLVDWKGIGDENQKKLPCNELNKRAFLNQHDELAAFVLTQAAELKNEMVEAQAAKNLKKSQSGETQKKEQPVAKNA